VERCKRSRNLRFLEPGLIKHQPGKKLLLYLQNFVLAFSTDKWIGLPGQLPVPETLPSLILVAETVVKTDERTINQTAGLIMKTLSEFGIPATVIGYRTGPAVTQFAVQPGFIKKPGVDEEDAQQMKVRVAQIASLEKDLALALSAERLRIEAPVPGKPYVGIEVPNTHSTIVRLKPLLESASFQAQLSIALGRDVNIAADRRPRTYRTLDRSHRQEMTACFRGCLLARTAPC
jgi:DNA segregation ATPase FtsK/SpoIIIE-like protein